MAGEAASRKSLTVAFQKRQDLELRKLREHLHEQLQRDIARIYSNSLYCDLELVFNTTTIHTHSSILKVRAEKFFSKLRAIPSLTSLQDGLQSVYFEKRSVECIKSFIRDIYSKCTVTEEEKDAVRCLEEISDQVHGNTQTFKRNNSFDTVLSPESDIFLTPNCSPSELYPQSGNQKPVASFVLDGSYLKTVESKQDKSIINLHKTNQSYYSIVPVDEIFVCSDSVPKQQCTILEKELEEQDELLKSFQSIKSKENNKNTTRKLKKPTTLPFLSSHLTKKQKRGCDSNSREQFLKNSKRVIDTRQDKIHQNCRKTDSKTSVNGKVNCETNGPSCEQCENKERIIKKDEEREQEETEVKKNSKVNFTLHFSDEKFINTFVDNTVEDDFMCSPIEVVDSVLECCKRRETTEDLPYFSCSPEMDASGGGPDSGLDTSSTGCLPAGGFSSPREHTVSETSGVDLTEAAIGEDMPHDGDDGGLVARPVKSSASSSVSSEAGTWDSTFPPSNSDTGQEQNTEDKTNTDSVKTLPANRKQDSEYWNDEKDVDGEAVIKREKSDNGFSSHVSAPVQEKPCISQQTNNVNSDLPIPVTSVTNISLQTKSEENLGNSSELPKTKISGSAVVNKKQNDICDKYSEMHDSDKTEKHEDREIKEDTNKIAPEDEASDTEGKLKDEFGTNYVETKFIPGLYSSYNERCNDWWLEPSPHSSLGSQNYFIDAASLVDDSEVSLPPFQMSKSDQVVKDTKENELPVMDTVTATPHTSPVSERSKLSSIAAPEIDIVSSTAPPVSQVLSAVKIKQQNLLESDLNVVNTDEEVVDRPNEHLKGAPELAQPKYTHLKPSATRLDGQDSYAEFEKELKLSESFAPQIALQKLHREGMRRRWDSCSEEMLGGSSRQFDTVDALAEVCKSDLNIIHTVSIEDNKEKDELGHAISSSVQKVVKLERESQAKDSSCENSFSNVEPATEAAVDLESEFDRQKQCSYISWEGDSFKQEIYHATNEKNDESVRNANLHENPDAKHEGNCTGTEQVDGGNVTVAADDKSNTSTEAEPRPSLIRRNTFELDTDDEHLAILRQEYERRQGNLVFQSHIPQFSGHITGNEGFRDAQSLIMVGSDLTAEGIMTEYMHGSHISAPSSLLLDSSKLIANIDHTLNVAVPAALSGTTVGTVANPSTRIHTGEVKELSEMREYTLTDGLKIEPYSEVPVIELGVSEDAMSLYTNEYKKYCESMPPQKQEFLNSNGLTTDLAALSETDKDSQKYAAINYDSNSKPVVSGALTFSDIVEEKKPWDSPKKQKRTESTPIISGGVSTVDFSVKPRKINDSPVLSRRRNELAPILSGAAPALPETNVDTIDAQAPKNVSAKSAWVVDMSDCAVTVAKKPPLDSRRRRKSDIAMAPSKNLTDSVEQDQSVENKEATNGYVVELKESASQGHGLNLKSSEVLPKENKIQKSASASSVKSCGLGYFVDLSEPKTGKSERKVPSNTEVKVRSLKSNAQEGKSCGYFVGLGKEELSQKKGINSIVKQHSADEIKDVSSEKKNLMFSMFIDISAPKQETHPDMNGTDEKELSPSSPKRKTVQSIKTEGPSKSGKQNRIAGTTFDVADEKQHSSKGTYMYIDASNPSSVTEHAASAIDRTVKEMPEKKQAVFMFIESDSPVTRRKTLPSGLRPTFNRHSWNPETEERAVSRKQHKRAHSLSVDRSSLSTSSEEKSSSASSLSKSRFQSSSQSLSEDGHIVKQMSSSCHGRLMSKTYEKYVKRSLSSEGNSESEINTIAEEKNYSEKVQQKSSEALFIALEETDMKDSDSPVATDRSDQNKGSSVVDNKVYRQRRLAKGESEHTVLEKNVSSSSHGSDVECSSGSGDKRLPKKLLDQECHLQTGKEQELTSESSNRTSTVEVTKDGNAAEVEFRESEAKSAVSGSFVKLSDLDREPETKPDSCSVDPLPSFSSTGRMTRSIPETSWIENKLLMTRSIGSGATSKSLGRLFPHLHSTAASSSSPKTGHSKSPSSGQLEGEDNETQVSETSDLSSMQSSMGPSGLEGSTEETDASSSCAGRSAPVSRLGEDLLRMFLEEINPDVTVEVGGRRMKAHKCILSSRCQYFAAMLSGGWVESAGNVISLQGFSYNAVHFALCHIYSGASNIPDSISIVELATLADMLGLEGLKEVIMYTLKVKYCHFFHKPCSMCAVGVLECLPLAAAYGLDDIYRKSLKWITKHFVKIWPTKGFATLPRELIDKCFQQHVVHMTTDNVLETVTSCDKLLAIIPNVRWAEPVFSLASQLLEACIKFMASHFSGVLTSDSFLSLAKDSSWNISQLEDSLMAATDRLPPDQACQSYAHLHHILCAAKSSEPQPEVPWSSCFLELLERLQKRVEVSLVRQAPRAARSPSWLLMEPELQRRIQEAACLVLMPSDETHRSRHVSLSARHSSTSSSGSRSLDLRQVKLAMTQQARRTASGGRVSALRADSSNTSRKQQQQQQQQQQQHQQQQQQQLQQMPGQQSHQQRQHPSGSVAHKNGEVKTQESKQKLPKQKNKSTSCAATPEKLTATTRRPGRTISSSDSSRTSSPAMRRSAPGSDSSGKSRTFTTGSVSRGVSGTSPGRDAKGRRKKDGEFSMSADSLSELATNCAKVQLKETNDITKSKSRCSVPAETILVKKRVGDEITISTDSLSESAAVPERLKRQETTSQSAPNATRPDTPKERRHHTLGRIGTDITMSTDSLATAESFAVDNVPSKTENGKTVPKSPTSTSQAVSSKHDLNRTPTAKGLKAGSTRMENQQSPLPAIRKLTNRQTVLSPRDSPTARLRSGATSSPYSSSPSLRRNVLISSRPSPDNVSSINNNSKNAAPTKGVVQLKSERSSIKANASSSPTMVSSNRRTPPRLQGKNQLSSPAKVSSENKTSGTRSALREAGGTFTLSKTVINVNKVNNNALKKTVNGVLSRSKCVPEAVTQTKTKVETKKGGPLEDKPPSVGSRSGTFLKDEPTILKKPDVDNVQE
ncbi:uncharacterized protein LOC126481757 [Schistocerca serialis cubense]|uniref:uncharacterized protein LOC126481757 n=1 Tax=Schistocerca serialis cubense TaxID=2023355 RepID=UPI00214E6E10|nr:uncharacterized protein LOC126481757 [Schistocerca serialis cubense]